MSLTKDAHSKIVPVNSSMSINDCRCFDDYSNGFCRIGADVQKIWHNKQGKWLTQGSARQTYRVAGGTAGRSLFIHCKGLPFLSAQRLARSRHRSCVCRRMAWDSPPA